MLDRNAQLPDVADLDHHLLGANQRHRSPATWRLHRDFSIDRYFGLNVSYIASDFFWR